MFIVQIDLKQVNISIGNNDLLVDVDLKLKPGFHYAVSFLQSNC